MDVILALLGVVVGWILLKSPFGLLLMLSILATPERRKYAPDEWYKDDVRYPTSSKVMDKCSSITDAFDGRYWACLRELRRSPREQWTGILLKHGFAPPVDASR